MQDVGDLARDRHLRLLSPDPHHKSDPPSFESRPALGSMQQHTRGLEQIGSEQPIAPLRYAAVKVQLAGLFSTRRETEIGADALGRSEAGGIVDGVAECD